MRCKYLLYLLPATDVNWTKKLGAVQITRSFVFAFLDIDLYIKAKCFYYIVLYKEKREKLFIPLQDHQQ